MKKTWGHAPIPKGKQHGVKANSTIVARQGVSKFMGTKSPYASILKVKDSHTRAKKRMFKSA